VEGELVIGLAGAQNGAGEMGDVDRIGEMLGFEAKPAVPRVRKAALSNERTVQPVRRVKLQARFGGEHLHYAAGTGLNHAGAKGGLA